MSNSENKRKQELIKKILDNCRRNPEYAKMILNEAREAQELKNKELKEKLKKYGFTNQEQ